MGNSVLQLGNLKAFLESIHSGFKMMSKEARKKKREIAAEIRKFYLDLDRRVNGHTLGLQTRQ